MSQAVSPVAAFPYRRRGINFRIIAFVGVIAVLLGVPVYIYLATLLSGGIEKDGDYLRVDLKSMSTFDMDQRTGSVNDVPTRYRDLDGKKVILVGELAPGSFSAAGATPKFQLVYSVAKCCVTPDPKIQHFVQATASPEVLKDFPGASRLEVRGTLHVKITPESKDPDTKIDGVYHVDVESIRGVG